MQILESQHKNDHCQKKIEKLKIQIQEEEHRPLEVNNNAYFIKAILEQVGGEDRMRVINDREVERIVLKQPQIQNVGLLQLSTLLHKVSRAHKQIAIGKLKLHTVSIACKKLKFRQGLDLLR